MLTIDNPSPSQPVASVSLTGHLLDIAARMPAALAILAPGRQPARYADLLEQFRIAGEIFTSLGIAPHHRIAVALPDSAEMAVLTLALIGYATALTINPVLSEVEVVRQLQNLGAAAIIVPADVDATARRAAMALGLPIIEIKVKDGGFAGQFNLQGPNVGPPVSSPAAAPCSGQSVAMVLQTSGTTGDPKVVPLTHANLLPMMLGNISVLELTPRDRCLSMMPLFHLHGLGAVLVSLLSGGSVVVTPGFSSTAFFDWLEQFEPTWYTAVPAIHQAILTRAPDYEAIVRKVAAARSLRFARSGSAPMPRGMPEKLEGLFNTIYVEASGATEASAYICSNRPAHRRIGSVGMPMPNTDVRIINEDGLPVGPNTTGELVARGPGIFAGYENNPAATSSAFIDGYFRTGDLGHCDTDGFFYITGRVKEQINRGGMKVSPGEVEEALLKHPAVAEAVVFALPDARLGDEVAAAVVLRAGQSLTALALQRDASERVADYKVPRQIVFVEQIPRGRTGKLVRIGLAEKLGLIVRNADTQAANAPAPAERPVLEPNTPAEQALAAIWSEAIGRSVTDIDLPFVDLGGDSLQALAVTVGVEKQFGHRLPLAALFTCPTIRTMVQMLESDGWQAEPGAAIVLREGSRTMPTLFVMPGILGNVYNYYAMARHLPLDQRVIGLPLPGADGREPPAATLNAMAERFVALVRREQQSGPYLLSGYSLGGRIAFEVATRLHAEGAAVGLLAMFDTPAPGWPPPLPPLQRLAMHARRAGQIGPVAMIRSALARRRLGDDAVLQQALEEARGSELTGEPRRLQEEMIFASRRASRQWRPAPLDLPIRLFRAGETVWTDCDISDPAMGWSALTSVGVRVTIIPGTHGTIFHEPNTVEFAGQVSAAIAEALNHE